MNVRMRGIIQAGKRLVSIWPAPSQSRVRQVVEEAFRRSSLVLLVEHLAVALAVVFAGLILLLLLGTQIFDGRWLLLLALVGLTIMFVRIRRRILSRYRVAQLVDQRLQLSDSLSTAWFLPRDSSDRGLCPSADRASRKDGRNCQAGRCFPAGLAAHLGSGGRVVCHRLRFVCPPLPGNQQSQSQTGTDSFVIPATGGGSGTH